MPSNKCAFENVCGKDHNLANNIKCVFIHPNIRKLWADVCSIVDVDHKQSLFKAGDIQSDNVHRAHPYNLIVFNLIPHI